MDRGHFWRRAPRAGAAADEPAEIEVAELTQALAAPGWLRDAGATAWLLVGDHAVPGRRRLDFVPDPDDRRPGHRGDRRGGGRLARGELAPAPSRASGTGRGPGAVGIVAVGVGMFMAVIGGITSQSGDISAPALRRSGHHPGVAHGHRRRFGHGVDAKQQASSSSTDAFNALVHGVARRAQAALLPRLLLVLTVLSLFFLLKDGPTIRAWGERHIGVPGRWPGRSAGACCSPCAATSSG